MRTRSYFRQSQAVFLLVLALTLLGRAQPSQVISWGTFVGGPAGLKSGSEFMAVCAGGYHNLALTADHTLMAWGENGYGQCTVPSGNNFSAIAAGQYHSLALRTDGTVAAWGDNTRGQCNVPPKTKFRAIAAGTWHSLGVRMDGTLVAWGWNEQGQCNVPPGHDYSEVAGGYYHSLALKTDGSIVAWGDNGDGQCNVPTGNRFSHISAGWLHSVALRANGTLAAWGRNSEGQCQVPAGSDFTAIAAGSFHTLALQTGGHVEAWGQNAYAQCDTPEADNIAAIAAGKLHSLAIRDVRTPLPRPSENLPNVPPAPSAPEKKENGGLPAPASIKKPSIPTPGTGDRSTTPSNGGSTSSRITPAPKPQQPPAIEQDQAKATQPSQGQTTPASGGSTNSPTMPAPKSQQPPAAKEDQTKTLQPPPGQTVPGRTPDALKTDVNRPADQGTKLIARPGSQPVDPNRPVTVPAAGRTAAAADTRHFFTTDETETKQVDPNQWEYLGYAFYTYPAGRQPTDARPVYRFRSRSLNRYYFTADPDEIQKYTMDADWESKVAWYVPAEKTGEAKGDQLHRQGLAADLYSSIKDKDMRPVRHYILKSGPAVPGTAAKKPATAEPRAASKDASKTSTTSNAPKPESTPVGKPNAGPASSNTTNTAAGQSSTPAARTAAAPDQVGVLTGVNDPAAQGLTADLYLEVTGNAVPVYHFTSIAPPGSMAPKQHFCTISEEEMHKLIDTQSSTWKYERIAFFAYAEGSQPPGARAVYRFWSQRLNRYFFTMDESLKQTLTDKFKDLWQYQGIAWYAPPVKPSDKK